MNSQKRFRSSRSPRSPRSSRSSRRRALTASDIAELKRFKQRQMLERFRTLTPIPMSGHGPALTTTQMMKFNVFQDSTPKPQSKKKRRSRRK